MMKIDVRGIKGLQKLIENKKDNVKNKINQALTQLSDIGLEIASINFMNARYDGTNDVKVSVEWNSNFELKVVANGKAVAFIEFGTGIIHTQEKHPEAKRLGMKRGGYGQGKGNQPFWLYNGDTGSHGRQSMSRNNQNGQPLVWSEGNPAARAMMYSHLEMKEKINEVFKEVFEWQ